MEETLQINGEQSPDTNLSTEQQHDNPSLYPDQPVYAECRDGKLWVSLADGRTIGTPLAWYPRLVSASDADRECYQLMPTGIHWPTLDEDLSVQGMLQGKRPRQTLRDYLTGKKP